jgi:hypothetical protein
MADVAFALVLNLHQPPGNLAYAWSIRLAGTDWLLASGDDPPGPAPALPR